MRKISGIHWYFETCQNELILKYSELKLAYCCFENGNIAEHSRKLYAFVVLLPLYSRIILLIWWPSALWLEERLLPMNKAPLSQHVQIYMHDKQQSYCYSPGKYYSMYRCGSDTCTAWYNKLWHNMIYTWILMQGFSDKLYSSCWIENWKKKQKKKKYNKYTVRKKDKINIKIDVNTVW